MELGVEDGSSDDASVGHASGTPSPSSSTATAARDVDSVFQLTRVPAIRGDGVKAGSRR